MTRPALTVAVMLLAVATQSFGSPKAAAATPWAATPWANCAVGDSVAVLTHGGRTLRGAVDYRTDDQAIWLEVADGGVAIASRTPVGKVARVVSAAEVTLPPMWNEVGRDAAAPLSVVVADPAPATSSVKVQSLEVAVRLGNLDADSVADGLQLWLQPIGTDGRVLPVAGSVRAELLLEDGGFYNAEELRVRETWTQPIAAEAFTADGFRVDLPFRSVDPQQTAGAFPMGVLRVRLLVPGQGAFDAIVSDLPLRAASWNRDRVQQRTGQRTLPGESRL